MIPIMEHAYSPTPSSHRGNEKVLISIDDTALIQGESPRADGPSLKGHSKSLNRLDRMEEDGEIMGQDMFKCPSYPRLLGGRDRISVDPSISHVDTDSISPRVSTENLSYNGRGMPVGATVLMRSVSARTVDSLPPLEFRQQAEARGANFLSPGEQENSLVSRSTSCPSMAYKRSPCPSPTSHNSPRPFGGRVSCPTGSGMHGAAPAVMQRAGEHEINLEGEVIPDLPIEPRQNFPDFIPEDRDTTGQKFNTLEQPMHTRKLKEGRIAERERLRLNGDHKPRFNVNIKENKRTNVKLRQGYVNIGDIPTTLAQKVISEHNTYKPEVDEHVQAKCLHWLNSLDHD